MRKSSAYLFVDAGKKRKQKCEDKQIARAKAVNDGDRFIVAMVAQWRQEALDCTMPIASEVNVDW
jgi:hypothetical protein